MRKSTAIWGSLILAGMTITGRTPLLAAEAKVQPAKPADADLTKLAIAFLDACVTRDADYVAAHSIDDPVGSFTGIGSGTGDKWTLQDTLDDLRGLKKVGWEGLDPKGYVIGDAAWFSDLAYGVLPDGKKITIRISLVLRKVGSDWKAVHFHVSEGLAHGGIKKDS
jgi:hypothetical protein